MHTPSQRLLIAQTVLTAMALAACSGNGAQAAALPDPICSTIHRPDRAQVLREQSALGQRGPLELVKAGVRLNVADEFLFARQGQAEADAAVSVKQFDGGEITGLFKDTGGGVWVVGTRDTYRVALTVAEGRVRLAPVQRLAHLYRERCSFWTHWFNGCQRSAAVYSAELSAVVVSGFDRQAQRQSWAYGLDTSQQPRLLLGRQGDFLQYMFDVRGTKTAVFKGSQTGRLYLFDGSRTTECVG